MGSSLLSRRKSKLIKKTDIRRRGPRNPVYITYIGTMDSLPEPSSIGEVAMDSSTGKLYITTNAGWEEIACCSNDE